MKKFLLPVLAVITLCVVQQASGNLASTFNTYSSNHPQVQAVLNQAVLQFGNDDGVMQQIVDQLNAQYPGQKITKKLQTVWKDAGFDVPIG